MYNEFIELLKKDYPKSWSEFIRLAEDVLKESPATLHLKPEELPFEMLFGIMLRFFKENDMEFDYNNLSPSEYTSEIRNLFSGFELVIGHYS